MGSEDHPVPEEDASHVGIAGQRGGGAAAAVAAVHQDVAAAGDGQRLQRVLLDHDDGHAVAVDRADRLEQSLGGRRAPGPPTARRAAARSAPPSAPSPWPGSGAGRPTACGRRGAGARPAGGSARRSPRSARARAAARDSRPSRGSRARSGWGRRCAPAGTKATPSALISRGAPALNRGVSFRRTRPRLGASTPAMTLSSVDLPAPLGPITLTISPGGELEVHALEDLVGAV